MFTIRRRLSLALVVGATAAFACSSGLPDEAPQAQGGSAGRLARAGSAGSNAEDAGTANGGDGHGGNGSNEAGSDSYAGDGGADSSDPNGAEGGNDNAKAGAQNLGGIGGNANGGSAGSKGGGSPGHAGSGGGLFTLTEPSAECAAAPAVDLPLAPTEDLTKTPKSGHVCDAANSFEPNDGEGQACQLVLGDAIATQISGTNDKVDNFVFRAEAGVRYTLIVSTLLCDGPTNYIAVDAKSLAPTPTVQLSVARAYFHAKNAFEIESNVTADELVTLQTGLSCPYDIQVVQSTAHGLQQGSDYEPNDTASIASMVELNQLVKSGLSGPTDTDDYFTIPVQANVTYSVHVSTEDCVGTTNYIALSGSSISADQMVANIDSKAYFDAVRDVEFRPQTSGLELLRFYTTLSCNYKFYVLPSTICGLEHGTDFEPNNTAGTAAPIAVGQTIQGGVKLLDQDDYYGFQVEPKTKYTLSLSADNCPGSLNYLVAQFWSGRTEEVDNNYARFYYSNGTKTFQFVTGSATQELLHVYSSASCEYEFTISKG